MILLVCGYPGCGKTTFANKIKKRFKDKNVIYYSTDEIRILYNLGEKQKDLQGEYTQNKGVKEEIYETYKEIEEKLKRKISKEKLIILDGTYREENMREKIIDLAKGKDKVILVKVFCENEKLIEDLLKRRGRKKHSKSFARKDTYLGIKKEFEHPSEKEKQFYYKYFEIDSPFKINKKMGKIIKEINAVL